MTRREPPSPALKAAQRARRRAAAENDHRKANALEAVAEGKPEGWSLQLWLDPEAKRRLQAVADAQGVLSLAGMARILLMAGITRMEDTGKGRARR